MEVPALCLFVYGTLKRGHQNHARYCSGYRACVEASVLGRLYDLPAGYPMLVVAPESILAVGTSSPVADVTTQATFVSKGLPTLSSCEQGEFVVVRGELLTFDDAPQRLPAIDALEDFTPGRPSLYLRVLLATIDPPGKFVWAYVAPEGRLPPGAQPIAGWPEAKPVA